MFRLELALVFASIILILLVIAFVVKLLKSVPTLVTMPFPASDARQYALRTLLPMTSKHQFAEIIWLMIAAFSFLSSAPAGEPLSAELLEHGRRQVEYMIKDRPNMGAYPTETGVELVRPTDPFYEFAVRKFAGEDTESPVFWDASIPATEAEHTPPTDDNVG